MYLKKSEELADKHRALLPIIEKIDQQIFKHPDPQLVPESLAGLVDLSTAQATSALLLFAKEKILAELRVARCENEDCEQLMELEDGAAPKRCSGCDGKRFRKELASVFRLSHEGAANRAAVTAGFETVSWPTRISEYRGKVDAAVLSIKREEFEAVLKRVNIDITVTGRRQWNMCRVWSEVAGRSFRLALARANGQGNQEGYAITRDAIDDFAPGCVLVVGIAGAVPGDLTLGDTVFGNHVHDLTVHEVRSDGTRAFSLKGGPIATVAQNILSNSSVTLPPQLNDLGLPPSLPEIDPEAKIKGDNDAREKIRKRLVARYGNPPTAPTVPYFVDGEIASSDALVKYGELVGDWRKIAKHILAVDMESAGACKAGREHTPPVPVVPVRSISDVIGLERDENWTNYACEVAAAFALAFIRSWKQVPGAPPT